MKIPKVRTALMEKYSAYYDDLDPEWRRIGSVDKADNIVSLCRSYPHSSVLDLGTGDGAVLQRLSERGFGERLFAIEISRSGLERVHSKRISALKGSVLFDGYMLPYKDGAFDLTIISHVLEHVEHPRHLLYAASRVSKYLYVEVPLEHTLGLSPNYTPDPAGHINFYSLRTIRRLLQTCGLKILSSRITNRSRASYRFSDHRCWALRFAVKELLLRISGELASGLMTYHAAFLCVEANEVSV